MSESKVTYNYSVDVDNQVLFLIYLSHTYRIDLEMLILLYNRIGEDIFFIFYLLAGKSLIMPKPTKMIKIRNFVEEVLGSLSTEDEVVCTTQQEKRFLSFIDTMYNKEDNTISIDFEIPVKEA